MEQSSRRAKKLTNYRLFQIPAKSAAKSLTPKYFYFRERQVQILHTRLRTKCSSLNHDIFLKNLTDSPLCRCGSIKNAEHYLLQYILYRQQRIDILYSVSQLCHVHLMFHYLVTAHFLLTQTIKYSYQYINLLKTQNDSNTPSNLATSLKVKNIYLNPLIHICGNFNDRTFL